MVDANRQYESQNWRNPRNMARQTVEKLSRQTDGEQYKTPKNESRMKMCPAAIHDAY